jgi:uncharacterized membrane protein (Fun14 family)
VHGGNLSDTAKDVGAWALAGVAIGSWLQGVALIVTILAGLASLSLALLRWHDRIKYGPMR